MSLPLTGPSRAPASGGKPTSQPGRNRAPCSAALWLCRVMAGSRPGIPEAIVIRSLLDSSLLTSCC